MKKSACNAILRSVEWKIENRGSLKWKNKLDVVSKCLLYLYLKESVTIH